MKTLLLISSDDELKYELSRVLTDKTLEAAPRAEIFNQSRKSGIDLAVLDCRDVSLSDVPSRVLAARVAVGLNTPVTVIVRGPCEDAIRVTATIGDRVTEMLVEGNNNVAAIIEAQLRDESGTASAPLALSVLLAYLPVSGHETARTILGSGLRVSSVKQVAAALDESRGNLNRRIHRNVDYTAAEITELSKASFAAVLLRNTHMSVRRVCEFTKYSRQTRLNKLLVRVFATSSSELRKPAMQADVCDWLSARLPAAHAAAIRRRRRPAGG